MMSDVRGSQGKRGGDSARLLHATVRERLLVALSELFVPPRYRLTEWHRVTMVSLLARVVRSVEDELRSRLILSFDGAAYPSLHAALSSWHVEIALPILESSAALRDPELVSFLLRRVEEHRLHRTVQLSPEARNGLILDLVRDKQASVAEAAMAVLIALSRRLDRFQDPTIASTDLPAELEHGLVWVVAAALRTYLIERHSVSPADADDAVSKAAAERLWDYDEGEGLEARCVRLVRLLDELGRLDDSFVARSLPEAGLPLLLAGLAQRCSLGLDASWEIFSDPEGEGPPLLLRAASLDRDQAGEILVTLTSGPMLSDDALLERQLAVYDGLSARGAQDSLRLWQVDPAYRAAIARVAASAPEALTA